MFNTEINNFYNCFGDQKAWCCQRNEIVLYIHE